MSKIYKMGFWIAVVVAGFSFRSQGMCDAAGGIVLENLNWCQTSTN